jgi:hypothetical protein
VICIIPCYDRPEMLAVTLDYIVAANDSQNYLYLFFQDSPENKDVTKLINEFPYFNHHIQIKKRRFEGCDFIIGEALKYAYELGTNHLETNRVLIIEEDAWVGKDFFEVIEKLHNQFNPFSTSLVYNHYRKRQVFEDKPDIVYTDSNFQSIAGSINFKFLEEITKHFTEEYYEDPDEYCERNFSRSKIPFTTWDGITGRVMIQLNEKCLFPFVARAAHAGYYGLHRTGNKPSGISLGDKIRNLRMMNDTIMNDITSCKDIKIPNLETDYNVQDFKIETVRDYRYFI